MWLPRFIDKSRHHLAGTLAPDYQGAFCNPLGIDGIFLRFFEIMKPDILEVIRTAPEDDAVAVWFTARPQASAEAILRWNELAPNIGRPEFPGGRTFRWGMKYVYPKCTDPRVTTGFLAIAWDEGFLDDILPADRVAPTRDAP